MRERFPRFRLFGPHRTKQALVRAAVATSEGTLGGRAGLLLLDRDLDRLGRFLLHLGVGNLLVVVIVVCLRVALLSTFDGEEVVEVGQGGSELESVIDGVEVERICGEACKNRQLFLRSRADERESSPFRTTPTR